MLTIPCNGGLPQEPGGSMFLSPDELADICADGDDPEVIDAMAQYDDVMESGELVIRLLKRMGADPLVIAYIASFLDSMEDPFPASIPCNVFGTELQQALAFLDADYERRLGRVQCMEGITWQGRRLEDVVSRI